MILNLEIKKLKRTGYFPTFLAAGLLATAFPLINMIVRPETFTSLAGDPFDILMDANWQLMAMLNILASICGACIMYHTEFADSGAQKMDVLPIGKGKLFLAKFFIAALMLAIMVVIEIVSLAGCARYWFLTYELDILRLLKDAGFQWMATVPTVMLMLVIASICKNMWVSLGVGVILVFTMSVFPQGSQILSLCPFSTPYQTFASAMESGSTLLLVISCGVEAVTFALMELLYQKLRGCAQ